MELICLDTHVLIWGIQEVSTPNRGQMIPKAKAFLTSLDLGDRHRPKCGLHHQSRRETKAVC